MAERLTVSIDYCPQCRGIWLEKGKLDQIIAVAGNGAPQPISSGSSGVKPVTYSDHNHDHDHHHGDHDYEEKKHKKKSFLDELF
jgi:uncharacterized protein